MYKLFQGRNHPPANVNRPLPEPLVDPDEGKTPIGELVIIPIQGRDLPNRERFGKQNPYVLFKLGNVSKKSSTDPRGGQRPRWKDEQINMLMYESDAKDATSLYVTCLDEDHQKDDLIGDCVINLAKVLEQGEQDDWFELHYKGREAGQLMLQLTYYSYDPTHPTNKMNRAPKTPVPSSGGPARRPIHPSPQNAGRHSPAASSAATTTASAYVAEPGPPPTPAVAGGYPAGEYPAGGYPAGGQAAGGYPVGGYPAGGYPAGGYPAGGYPAGGYPAGGYPAGGYPTGGRVSPAGQNHYTGSPIPPSGQCGANPYTAVSGYPAHPNLGAYPHIDSNKRLSLPNQPQQQLYPPQQGGGGYPPVGYNNPAGGYPPQPMQSQGGYPPQFNTATGYPPQLNSFNNGYPPQLNNNNAFNGYPPQQPFNSNTSSSLYPPLNNGVGLGIGGLYPPVQQPLSRPASAPGGVGYPPVGYPFSASDLYPPTNVGYPPQVQQPQQPQQPHQLSPVIPATTNTSSSQAFTSTHSGSLPGAFPGAYPAANNSDNNNNNNNNSTLTGHKQSVNNGYSTSTHAQGQYSSAPMAPGDLRSRSASPPALPPRNQPWAPPSYAQTMYGSGRN